MIFSWLDNEAIGIDIRKRDYLKIYHQQGASFNNSDQKSNFIFGGENNYHQICIAYLEFDIAVRKVVEIPNYLKFLVAKVNTNEKVR